MNHALSSTTPAKVTHSITPANTQLLPEVRGQRFDAGVTGSELNETLLPGPRWSARAIRISRSHLVISCKRMTYVGRSVLLAVHKIDSSPLVLAGTVEACDYASSGLYVIAVALAAVPESDSIAQWANSFTPRDQR